MGSIRPRPALSPRKDVRAFRLVVIAVLLCALALVGCGEKHHFLAPVLRPPIYQQPSVPEVVLQNLALAYAHRDSTEYKSLFDGNYQGSSIDMRNPSPQVLTFTKADEAQHIAGLAKSTTITSVNLQLRPVLVRLTDAGDPPGWALIQNPIFSLSIYDAPNSYDIRPSAETMEFRFIPTLDSSSPTDTTWKIIRWTEIAQ
jgi:hypothetical protein